MAPTQPAAGRPSGRLRAPARVRGRPARARPCAGRPVETRRARGARGRGRARADRDQLRGAGGGRDQVDLIGDAGEAVGMRAQQRVDRQLRARQAPRAQVARQRRERPARALRRSMRPRKPRPCWTGQQARRARGAGVPQAQTRARHHAPCQACTRRTTEAGRALQGGGDRRRQAAWPRARVELAAQTVQRRRRLARHLCAPQPGWRRAARGTGPPACR